MGRVLLCAVAAFPLLAAPAFAQEGGSVFTNAPNELPSFLQNDEASRKQAEAAGPFGHSMARAEPPRDKEVAKRAAPRTLVAE